MNKNYIGIFKTNTINKNKITKTLSKIKICKKKIKKNY